MRNSIVKIKIGQRTIQEPKPHIYRDWSAAYGAWVWRCNGQTGETKEEAYGKWYALFISVSASIVRHLLTMKAIRNTHR